MRLYYFTTERFGLEAVRDNRLKIARVNELNDPFEFMGLELKQEDRKVLREWKQQFADRFGLICMSRGWQHPLLWGHYAEKHRGLCLGFDVAENGMFREVKYHAERPTLSEIGCNSMNDINDSDMDSLLFMKFRDWEYESEYRAFCELKEKDPVSDLYFLPFSENLKLAQVIVGARSSVTRGRLADVLRGRATTVTSFKARAGFRKFEVVENKLKEAWQ